MAGSHWLEERWPLLLWFDLSLSLFVFLVFNDFSLLHRCCRNRCLIVLSIHDSVSLSSLSISVLALFVSISSTISPFAIDAVEIDVWSVYLMTIRSLSRSISPVGESRRRLVNLLVVDSVKISKGKKTLIRFSLRRSSPPEPSRRFQFREGYVSLIYLFPWI